MSAFPTNFVNQLFGEVFRKLTNGGDPSKLGPNNMILWEPVPYIIDPEAFDFASKSNMPPVASDSSMTPEQYEILRSDKKLGAYAFQEEFARIADEIPSFVTKLDPATQAREFAIYSSDAENTISRVYEIILGMSQIPTSKIDAKVQKKIDAIRKKFFTAKTFNNPDFDDTIPEHADDNPKKITNIFPTKSSLLYTEYMDKYNEVNDEYMDLVSRADNGDTQAMSELTNNGKNWKKKVTKAENDWISFGSKNVMDKAAAELEQLEATNFAMLKKKYKEEFQFLKKTGLAGGDYNYAAPIPAKTLKNRKDWLNFTFNKSEYEKSSKNTSHSWSAGASYACFVSVDASGKHTNEEKNYSFEDFKMSFKIGKVAVSRPGINLSFIKSGYWRMSKDGETMTADPKTGKTRPISDGNGGGLMPAICTELYFITDLVLGFDKGTESFKRVQHQVEAGLDVNIGPFSLDSKYSYKDDKMNQSGSKEKQGISSNGILLIGRKFSLLDTAPNPLKTIPEQDWE